MNYNLIFKTLARLVVLFTAIPVHETAHGLVAGWLGDPTAQNAGRLTLNPFAHFDLVGTLSLLLVGIGWAKPVPVDARYFKNPRAGMAVTAAAGPLSNVIMALLSMICYKLVAYSAPNVKFWVVAALIFYYMTVVNISLAIFNMLPVPPFDGSRIFTFFLPERVYFSIMKYERYIYLAVLALVLLGVLDKPLGYLNNGLYDLLDKATSFIRPLASGGTQV